jgi:1-acyl-sn-glycerol-3-phosphate acyltransferase
MRSIFDTPVLTPLLRWCARLGLRLSGWQLQAEVDFTPPAVCIGAPHTSNWDCLLLLALALELRLKVCWLGKDSLFRFPFGGLMRWLGGIPINRAERCNQVQRSAEFLRENPDLLLCVAPEGTRRKVERWRSGFYHIAHLAGVPILLAVLDADARTVRVRGVFTPSGDAEREIAEIQRFYCGYRGIIHANTCELPESPQA